MLDPSAVMEHLKAHSPLHQEERPSSVAYLAFCDPMNRFRPASETIPIPLQAGTQ